MSPGESHQRVARSVARQQHGRNSNGADGSERCALGTAMRNLRKALGIKHATGYRFAWWKFSKETFAVLSTVVCILSLFYCHVCSGSEGKGLCTCASWPICRPRAAAQDALEQLNHAVAVKVKANDARLTALDILETVSEEFPNRHQEWRSKLQEIRTSVETFHAEKGIVVVLYCMSESENCKAFMDEVRARLKEKGTAEKCFFSIKPNGQDHEDNAGKAQKQIASALEDCSKAVIEFVDLPEISLGEMNALHNAISEHGSLMCNGNSIKTTDALYLLPWTQGGKEEKTGTTYASGALKGKGDHPTSRIGGYDTNNLEPQPATNGDASHIHVVRAEVFSTVSRNGNTDDETERIRAFRRRIDHSFPITL